MDEKALVVIAEVHPALDGEYEIDMTFTNFQLHAIKRATGLTAGELGEAYERRDADLIVGLALAVLMREGKITSRQPWNSPEIEVLWNAPVGALYLKEEGVEADTEEADAGPPEMGASEPDSPSAENATNGSSGESSEPLSVLPESVPSLTGEPT